MRDHSSQITHRVEILRESHANLMLMRIRFLSLSDVDRIISNFSAKMKEKNQSTITLRQIAYDIFEQLINYIYTGKIIISPENVQNLLPAASLWELSAVQGWCCEFLIKQLDPANCLGVRSFADTHSCKELFQASDEYIRNNFSKVVQTEEFLLLSSKDVEDLVSESTLNVSGEEDVYNAVFRWIEYDITSRKKFLTPFFAHIKLPLVSQQFLLERVSTEKLIQDNFECKNLYIEAIEYHLSSDRSKLAIQRTIPRKPQGSSVFIFAVGCAKYNEYYNPDTNIWLPYAPTQVRRLHLGVTSLDRLVYAIGGSKFDGPKIGGSNVDERLSSGECYDPLKNEWQSIKCMSAGRSDFGIASLKRMIYVTGGAPYLNSVEKYDPIVNSWSAIASMRTQRCGGRLVALGDCLYALGGFDGYYYLSAMERMDPRVSIIVVHLDEFKCTRSRLVFGHDSALLTD